MRKFEREEYVGDLKNNVNRFEKSYSLESQIGYLIPILEIEPAYGLHNFYIN